VQLVSFIIRKLLYTLQQVLFMIDQLFVVTFCSNLSGLLLFTLKLFHIFLC